MRANKEKGVLGGESRDTSISKIGAALEQQSNEWREAWKGAAILSSSRTVLVFASSDLELSAAQDVIQQLSKVNPARFFLLCYDPSLAEIGCKVSAVCHQLSSEQVILSEVVTLNVSVDGLPAIRNVIEANRLGNVPTQSVLISIDSLLPEFHENAVQLSDQIIIDSSALRGDYDKLEPLADCGRELLDLEWARTSLWRGEIRKAFNRPAVSQLLPLIGKVQVAGGASQREGPGSGALLLAGWILSCLQLELRCATHGGYEAIGGNGELVSLGFLLSQSSSSIERVTFSSRAGDESILDLCLTDRGIIESSSQILQSFRSSVQNEDLSAFKVLPRIFLVGPSLRHYNSSLRSAIEFEKLRSSYTL